MATIEQFIPRLIEHTPVRNGFTELIIAQTETYLGKILTYAKGYVGPLQYHVWKDETFYIFSGEAFVSFAYDDKLENRQVLPGMSFHVPPGAIHRVAAITDCVVFEVSNPVFNDRVNVEAEYAQSR